MLTFKRKPVVPGMLISSATALLLARLLQGRSLLQGMEYCVTGYKAKTGVLAVDQLLSRGGLQEMLKISLVAFCAFAFAGIIQKAGILDLLLAKILKLARTTALLIASAVAAALSTAVITGSAYLSVLIPGELFSPAFRARGLAAKNLARATQEVPLHRARGALGHRGRLHDGDPGRVRLAVRAVGRLQLHGIPVPAPLRLAGVQHRPAEVAEDETQAGS